MAYKAKDVKLQVEWTAESGTYTTVSERTAVSWSGVEVKTADSTDFDSTSSKIVATIVDWGEWSCDFNYDPTVTSQINLWTWLTSPGEKNVKLLMPGDTGTSFTAACVLTGWETSAGSVEDIMTGSATFKINEQPTKGTD